MAKTLIEQAEAAAAKAEATAEATAQDARAAYTRLLLRNASPQAGDRQELTRCMAALGKTAADVAEDAAIVGRYQSMRARALRVGELEQARHEAVRQAKIAEASAAAEIKASEDCALAAKRAAEEAIRRWGRAKEAQQDLPPLREKMTAAGLDVAALEPAAVDPQTPTERSIGQ